MTSEPSPRRFLGALSDRLNAVLVKDVRQALRGNYFRYTFWVTLSGATILAVLFLALEDRAPDGQQFLGVMFGFLAVATHALVPFFAFVAMGGEWEENTYDLLSLSDLRPRQIVLGKILSSGVQAMLYYSAFGPFLVFAFLLQGVDPLFVLFLLTASALLSLVLSTIAVAFSTLSTKRYARVFLHAALAAGLVMVTTASIQVALVIGREPHMIRTAEFLVITAVMTFGGLWAGAFAYAASIARLVHSEENASSVGRILIVAGVPLAWTAFAMILHWLPRSRSDADNVAFAMFTAVFLVLFASSILFASERERLGRRARHGVPRSRVLAMLAAPFLPGGGRGLVFYTISGGALLSGLCLLRMHFGETLSEVMDRSTSAMALMFVYGFVYLGLPYYMFGKLRTTLAVRLGTVALIGAAAILPSLAGFFMDIRWLSDGHHVGNPFWLVPEVLFEDWFVHGVTSDPDVGVSVLWPLFAALLVAGLANVKRVGVGLNEVLVASAENAARRRTEGAPEPEGHAA